MTRTIFLIVGQFIDYDFNPNGKTVEEVMNYFFSHDMKHEKSIQFYQSDTGDYHAGLGRIVYRLVNGKFQTYSFHIDSSG